MSPEAWIALAALVISLVATSLSVHLLRIERERRGEERQRQREADVRVRMIDEPGWLVLRNAGEAVAYDVEITKLTRRNGAEVTVGRLTGKLPLETLYPDEEDRITAALHEGLPERIYATLTWRDESGPHEIRVPVTEPPS